MARKNTSRSRRTVSRKQRSATTSPSPLPWWKKLLFSLLATALFFGAVELMLALFGVEPVLYDDDPYVGFSSTVPHFAAAKTDGKAVMETARNKLRLFHPQSFAADKPAGVTRVFCVGGSTTYGRPYGDVTSFCGWLRELLAAARPDRRWEIVNAGGISYASYRVALLMEELSDYQPDLFIIYSGHNEFLERRTYGDILASPRAVRGLAALASRTRIFTAAQQASARLRRSAEEIAEEKPRLDDEVRTLLDASVGPDAYHRDEALRDKVLRHYRFSLARMVDIARSAGAGAVFVNPASNLRHASPFKSEHRDGLTAAELEHWQALFDQAEDTHAEGRFAAALASLDEAAAIDGRYAHLHYLRGGVLDALGRPGEAKTAFERARDEDVCPLRALGPMRAIVDEVAAERRVSVVDFIDLVERLSPDGIPGEEVFLDHVHPTVEGSRRLALALLETLRRDGFVEPRPSWDEDAVRHVKENVERRLDPATHGLALSNLSRVLGWAGKLEEAWKLALKSAKLAPNVAAVHHQAGICAHLTDHLDEAVFHYRRALELDPSTATAHSNLAVILDEAGRDREAAVHYRRAIALLGDKNAAYRDSLRQALAKLEPSP
ncbi:MAG: tetratricopeptide repeat protein [Thermoanaerobaculia bacterium]